MKKNEAEVKKLRLSRETLHTLTSSDTQKVVGGADPRTSPGCPTVDDDVCGGA